MRRLAALTALAVLMAGCVSVSTDEAWQNVQSDVAARTGRLVRWNRGTDADHAVGSAVTRMLEAGLTAEEAVQIALLNNRRLQSVYSEIGIAQADLVQAGLLKNPVFDGVLRFVRHDGESYDLGVTQDFLDVFLIPLRKKLARARLRQAQLRVTAAVVELSAQVRIEYVRLQETEQMLAMRRGAMAAAEAAYQMAVRLREAGNVTELAVSLQRELFETSRLDVQSAESAAVRARERMNVLLGLWGRQVDWIVTKGLPQIPESELDLDGLEARVVAGSLDLAAAWQDLRAVAREMGVRVAEKVAPELAAGVEAEGADPGVWEVGPALALPIPLFDQGQAASARAKARMSLLWNRYTDLAVRLRSAARTAGYQLLAARRRAIYYRDVVMPLRENIMRQTQLRYNAMFLGVFQLLQAKRLEIEARGRYIRELANYWIARIETERLLQGSLVADSAVDMGGDAGAMQAGPNGGGH